MLSFVARKLRPRSLGYSLASTTSNDHDTDRDDAEREFNEKDVVGDAACGSEPADDSSSTSSVTEIGHDDATAETGLLADLDEKQHAASAHHRPRIPLAWHAGVVLVVRTLRRLEVFLPSFVVPDGKKAPVRLHPSAWLDGLRGISAFIVVWHHTSLMFWPWWLHDGWRCDDKPEHDYFMQRPFVRVLIAGPPWVKVFFVISGYAISHKALKLARQGRRGEVATTIASSVFRRHPRLFIPGILSTFASAMMGFWGLYGADPGEGEPEAWNDGAAVPTRRPPVGETFSQQWWHWLDTMRVATHPFMRKGGRSGTEYDWNLWTLSTEFDGSMAVFLVLAVLCWTQNRVRLALGFLVASYTLYTGEHQPAMFLFGMFMCDLSFSLQKPTPSVLPVANRNALGTSIGGDDAPASPLSPQPLLKVQSPSVAWRVGLVFYYRARRLALAVWALAPPQVHALGQTAQTAVLSTSGRVSRTLGSTASMRPRQVLGGLCRILLVSLGPLVSIASLVTSLYLLSLPEPDRGGRATPGYMTLIEWVPRTYKDDGMGFWWLSIGALLLVFTLDRSPFLQRPLMTRPIQYLGRISFALYIVHGPIIWTLGWHLGRWATENVESEEDYNRGAALVCALMWPVLIWVSDVVWRLVDVKAVEVAKWAWDRLRIASTEER